MTDQNIHDEQKEVVDHQQLSEINLELEELIGGMEIDIDSADKTLIEGLVPLSKNQTWMAGFEYKATGTSGDMRIDISAGLSLALDFESLFNGGMAVKNIEMTQTALQAKQVGGDKLNEEMADLVTNSVMPQALGVLKNLTVNKLSILKDGLQMEAQLPQKGYALLRRENGLVWFQFSWLLEPTNEAQAGLFKLDRHLFRDNVYVADELFVNNAKVNQRFAWNDLSEENNLEIELKAVFKKL